MDGHRRGTPWHLWVIGILSLLWSAGGAWDYLQVQLANPAYINAISEKTGVPAEEAMAYFAAFPAWMDAAWALGVWGAVAGSALLLLRSRWTVVAFIVAFFGLFIGTLHGISDPLPGTEGSTMRIVTTMLAWAIAIGLIFYSRKMAARNFVRSMDT